MTYIENVFICLAIPLLLSLFFRRDHSSIFTFFVMVGMGICLLSAYVSSFFMDLFEAGSTVTSIEITPVCEEIMKLLPLLFYFLIFEPAPNELPAVAIAIAVGFTTFENVCYLAENGAENFYFMLIRGISAGALHILCGTVCGFGISYVFKHRFFAFTGTIGILGFCTGFHGIYNLLITADGAWKAAGYVFPSAILLFLLVARRLIPHLEILS